MSASQTAINLASLFDQALQAVTAQREDINTLDGYNGNHGDNMVSNMRLVAKTMHANETKVPSVALRRAGQRLAKTGQGGTSQYYAQGLLEAAKKFEGRTQLEHADGITLLETLLGAVPAQDNPDPQQPSKSVLDLVMRSAQQSAQPQVQTQPQQPAPAAGVLDMLLTLTGAQQQQAQPQGQPQQQTQTGGILDMLLGSRTPHPQAEVQQQDNNLDLGDIVGKLLPAGLAYLQATQSGADPAAARLTLIGALLNAQPNQAQTPRQAAGTVIAQSILQTLMKR
ncbi:MAG TPA: hypothetical protein PLH19_09270 [Anaerolineae bacterium]|nr:hypothetical protein [Anaerolineae bacterium]HQH38707.1 hypothetical protein [Anaerolineae bacterium]